MLCHPGAGCLLVQQVLHALFMVFLVTFGLDQFALFTLAVIDEGLNGHHQEANADAQPDEQERSENKGLNCCPSVLPPLA